MSNNESSRRRTEEASPLHEDQKALNELGISSSTWQRWEKSFQEESDPPCSTSRSISYVIIGGLVSFNLVAFISLYPVLRGRGAPYLPSKRSHLDNMFQQLKQDSDFRKLIDSRQKLSFVDLGSGDGRVVFRAAREDIFHTATGYEINPMLHGFAQIRRMISPKYWRTTRFGIADIWKINLADVDVIAVYGLSPMMKDLGVKLQKELKPGSYILSNVFAIPGWKPIANKSTVQGTHIYRTPTCWSK